MGTRTRSMALDGHSVEADLLADAQTKAKVEVVILDILRCTHGATDDEITTLYESRAENYPGVPRVTPQRIRTARAALSRRGLVVASNREGRSALGNAATIWELPTHKNALAPAATGDEGQAPTKGTN